MSMSLDEVQEARGGVLATVPASAARTLFVGLFRILLVLLSSQLFALSLGPPSSAMAALRLLPNNSERRNGGPGALMIPSWTRSEAM